MTPLHERVHKIVHRIVGGAAATVGVLQGFQAIDLSPILGAHTGLAVAIVGASIAGLELLPVVVKLFEPDPPPEAT